jgi:hypothetical protein
MFLLIGLVSLLSCIFGGAAAIDSDNAPAGILIIVTGFAAWGTTVILQIG